MLIKNKYPLPRMIDLFDELGGPKVFLVIDFLSEFHQFRV